MKRVLAAIVMILAIGLNSCDRPDCINENQVFETESPESEKYKAELAKQLKLVDKSKLRYWLKEYTEEDGNELLNFYIQGDSLCAILNLTVNDWDKLEDIRKRKGVGRRGAEFTNLKFEVLQDSASTLFVYETYDRIID